MHTPTTAATPAVDQQYSERPTNRPLDTNLVNKLRSRDPAAFVVSIRILVYTNFGDSCVSSKKFWLLPVLLVVGLFGGMLLLAKGSALAPLIYTIF
jgi:hypothetical protein